MSRVQRNSDSADNSNGITIVQNKLLGPTSTQIQLDAIISETHDSTISITDNPVETGTIYTDNAIVDPKKYSFTAVVSNVKNSTGIPLGGSKASLSLRATYQDLVLLQQTVTPFDIVTPLFTYVNMAFINLTATQDKNSANVLIVTADFRQIQFGRTDSVILPIHRISPAAKNIAASKEAQGTKSQDDQGKITDPQNVSILKKITTGTSSFFRR